MSTKDIIITEHLDSPNREDPRGKAADIADIVNTKRIEERNV